MIFPRYHQLDAVRKLTKHSKANGSGHNYLIQHSTMRLCKQVQTEQIQLHL